MADGDGTNVVKTHADTMDVNACYTHCNVDAGCTHYSYDSDKKVCKTLKALGKVPALASGILFGDKGCLEKV